MKCVLLLSCCMVVGSLMGQQTIVLQPDAACGKDAFVWFAEGSQYNNENINYGASQTMLTHTWTSGGDPDGSRLLLDFDLSAIPGGATIESATLSIYNDPTSSSNNGEHSNLTGSNESVLRRITTPWVESLVTWNTQPEVTSLNEVNHAQTVDPHEDFENMDVTQLVSDMLAFPNESFGFQLSLVTEEPYRMLVMASSDHPDPARHPRLEITYTPEQETEACLMYRIDSGCGEDTFVWFAGDPGYNNEETNYSLSETMLVHAWTTNGMADQAASLLQWKLDGIPENAVITNAAISLYNNPTSLSYEGEHQIQFGAFQWEIRLINSPWDGSTVTWNNQPTTISDGAVILNSPAGVNDDMTNLDVTSLIQEMVDNPEMYYGLKLQLSSEEPYKALVFATSEHSDPTRHPLLKVCYSLETPDNTAEISSNDFLLYPNPTSGEVTFTFDSSQSHQISIVDSSGKCVFRATSTGMQASYDLSYLSSGIYAVIMEQNGSKTIHRFIKES